MAEKYYFLTRQLAHVKIAHNTLSYYKIEKGSLLQKILIQLSEELLSLSLQLEDLKIKEDN